jgi:hypothetical protein
MSGLAGCAADAGVKEEKLKMLQKYEQCVDQAKRDKKKLKFCEHYLKAVDAKE